MKRKITNTTKAKLPTEYGYFDVYGFIVKNIEDGKSEEVLALVKEPLTTPTPVRIHSQCITGDVMHSLRCDCRSQMDYTLRYIEKESGILIYLNQEGRGIGLFNKIKAYKLQDDGLDTVDANIRLGLPVDRRTYETADIILKWMKDNLGIKEILIITNNPEKMKQIHSIKVKGILHPKSNITEFNKRYIKTKIKKMGHRYA